jgi:hypothetical protein
MVFHQGRGDVPVPTGTIPGGQAGNLALVALPELNVSNHTCETQSYP